MNNQYEKLLSKLQNADEKEREWLMMEFSLQNLTDVLRQAVWAAAIPHWFDHAFLNAVLGFELKDSDFQALTELSFVESFSERGFNVHERSRNLLLDKLWKTNKARFQKLSKQAAAYCKKQDQNDTAWRIETIYHGLLANNTKAKENFYNQANDWFNSFQLDKLESLTQNILEASNNGFIVGEGVASTLYFQGLLDTYYSRYLSAQTSLQQALYIYLQTKNQWGEANCYFRLGNVSVELSDCATAQERYLRALPLYKNAQDYLGEANCIRRLGDVSLLLADYPKAQVRYNQALALFQKIQTPLGEANCIGSLGDVSRLLADYPTARELYNRALALHKKVQNRLGEAGCIKSLGLLDKAQQKIKPAVAALQQAMQIYEEIGVKDSKASCFDDLATLYQRQKQFKQALINFNQAIETFSDADWYQNRAGLYMLMEDYEKAEADIKQAETMGKNPAYTLLGKAELALWQKQTSQAVELSQQALAQRPADGTVRAIFALTLLANGQTEQATLEMQQALTAIYQPNDFKELLEYLDKLIRIYGKRAEFSAMRELIAIPRKQPNEE